VSNLLSCLTQVFGCGQNAEIIITGIIAQGIAKGISQHDFDLALATRPGQVMNSRSEGENFTPKESWRNFFGSPAKSSTGNLESVAGPIQRGKE